MDVTISPGALNRLNAAKYLGISERTLDRLAESGELTRIRIGTAVVFRVIDLDAYLAAKLSEATLQPDEQA